MLQFNDGCWEHRAYWGANQIGWGANGTDSRRYMGGLPATGGWVRLEVPASVVGLEGHTLNGIAFSLYGGRATWDRAGKSSGGTGAGVQWLIADQLGTPRMVVDKTGALSGVKRHDYYAFGEEVMADAYGRTQARGYVYSVDATRQKFTGYERDAETNLDYAQARYFASAQGRFTGVDPLMASASVGSPQTWNRYSYALNNPLKNTDPSGMRVTMPSGGGTAEDLQREQAQQQQQQQSAQPQMPKPTPAIILDGPTASTTEQERQLIQNAHAEAQKRVQENPPCAALLGGPVDSMTGLNDMVFVLDRSLTDKPTPQAAVEEVDGEPTGRILVNPTGALLKPPGSSHQFTLLQSPNETPLTLTLFGAEAGAMVILHERTHPAKGFGITDLDNPNVGGGQFDEKRLANNYMNNYKVWKACFGDRKPTPNSSSTLPR